MRRLIAITLTLISLSGAVYSDHQVHQAETYKLTGKEYFPEVKKLISQAKKSIYISMYIATYHPENPDILPNQLIQELVKAHKCGVKVRIILEQTRSRSLKDQYNDLAYFHLKDMGLQVDYDVTATKLHDKLIVIDERIVIIGSHNWSKPALNYNREASAVIVSPELAKEYIAWIESTPVSPRYTPPPSAKTKNVYLPYGFLTDPKLGFTLPNNKIVLYLELLKKWQENGEKPFVMKYTEAAEMLGIGDYPEEQQRRAVRRLLKDFNKRYGLVSYKSKRNEPLTFTLLDCDDRRKKLKIDPKECILIPGSFWEFGWIDRLSANAKYFYLICLIEARFSLDPESWWSHSQKHLDKKYHISSGALSDGVMELNRYNLLIVEYGELVFPFDKYLSAPEYLHLPLYSWEWYQEELKKLEELYGKEKLDKARCWAEVVLEENNLDVLEKLINYANEYGKDHVQYAIDIVADKRIANPKRSFVYVEGIILKHYRDKQEEIED